MITAADARKLANSGMDKAINGINNQILGASTMGCTEVQVQIFKPLDDPEIRARAITHLRSHGYTVTVARAPDPTNFTIDWK